MFVWMHKIKKITELCRELVEAEGLMFIDIVIRGKQSSKVIEVFMDSEEALPIETCAAVSRKILDALQVNGIDTKAYRLDVSSPGASRALKYPGQFPKHTGRQFDLKLRRGDKKEKIKAELVRVEGETLIFKRGKEEIPLLFKEIEKAKVLVSFS